MVGLAFGLIVVAMVYTVGKVSGCHINPAVTFALAATKRFPWSGVPAYWAAQVAGGIAGALASGPRSAPGVDVGVGFGVVDFNHDVTSWGSAMFVEGSARASCCSRSSASSTRGRPKGWAGLVIGLVIVAIIITVGPVTNASLNPARAIGPLLITRSNGAFHNWTSSCSAYIPADLVGAAVAASSTTSSRSPGWSSAPIKEAVTEPIGPTHSSRPPRIGGST